MEIAFENFVLYITLHYCTVTRRGHNKEGCVDIRYGVTSENLNAHVGRSTYRRRRWSYSLNGYTSIDVEEDLKQWLEDPNIEWYIYMYVYIIC